MKKTKIIAIMPAYNAEKSIVSFVHSLPLGVFDEIIVVDDVSMDDTYRVAKKLPRISLYRNAANLGYGGNLKMCLGIALSHGADVIMELHPDGEYGVDGILPAIDKVKNGAHLVLGNRFTKRPKGMYWQKILVTRLLTAFDNIFFATKIPDFHQGFRVYTRKLLTSVDYRAFSNDYVFSFEIIVAAIRSRLLVDWVRVTAQYKGEKRGARWAASGRYVADTFAVRLLYLLGSYQAKKRDHVACPVCGQWYLTAHRFTSGKFSLWFCHACQIGFTHPMPHSMAPYYPKNYWYAQGVLGWAKEMVFRLAQKRRITWILAHMKKGDVLDVGAGMGIFGRELSKLGFRVTSIDAPFAKLSDPDIQYVDFLQWKTTKRFDAIVFWQSLEHVPSPLLYLVKAKRLLKAGGSLYIEYPRYGSLESRVFGRYWYDLDIPRHLVHFTDIGMKQLLVNVGLTAIENRGIFAADYAPWGFAQSIFSFERRDMNIMKVALLLPCVFLGAIVEVCLHICGQSPIGLVIAKKV